MNEDLEQAAARTYPLLRAYQTRWSDNDMYGHLNNAKYYELFDSTINAWIAEHTGSDFPSKPVIGVVAQSGCRFHAELRFPGVVTVGFRVVRLGRTSVTYELAAFEGPQPRDDELARATGRWVHVYVDRDSGKPTAIPADLRAKLEELP